MEKNTKSLFRKCSPALAAGAGAAVCLTGGMGNAAVVTGTIAGSNGAQTVFNAGGSLKAFSSEGVWSLNDVGGGRISLSSSGRVSEFLGTGGYAVALAAGVTVDTGMAGGAFADRLDVPSNLSNQYFAVKFLSGTRYGWIHVVSSNASGADLTLDTWGYDDAGGSIKTLSESVTAKKLDLADSAAKLQWTNANEQGVARYAVEVKGADGAWTEVDGDAPGAGSYNAKVAGEGTYRLAVENIEGSTEYVDF